MIKIVPYIDVGKPMCYIFTDTEKRGGKEIGHVLVSHLGNRTCLLWNVYVWPKQRRKGYGTMLIKFLQGEMPKTCVGPLVDIMWTGFDRIITETGASPKESREMMRKCGFKVDRNLLIWENPDGAQTEAGS